MKASDFIASFLVDRGVKVVFGYIGGMITHLVDSLDKNQHIRYIQTYHEQTAAIAAEGYALETGNFGVAVSTSGPGATNMMTGIADAYFGSIPVLYITGQVNTHEYKYQKPIRQQGFQETDIVSLVKPITKYAVMVDKAEDLRYELEKAIYYATSARKGPVLIDLPMDISRAEIDPDKLVGFVPPKSETPEPINILQAIKLIEASYRPMLLLGGGCMGQEQLINDFLTKSQIPVMTSLMGRGAIDETYQHYLGMVGSYGNRCANMSIEKVDLLIVLGSRLDTRQTGALKEAFMSNGNIIHVDIDNNELECHRLNNRLKVNVSVKSFLTELSKHKIKYNDYGTWHRWLGILRERYNQDVEIERFVGNKMPYRFIQALNNITEDNDIITADIGQNQMWAAQTIRLKKGQRFITSGGLAPMGFSLPVAIGIAFANPDRRIYCLNGDGGFHMACQSLLLISQHNLNIKVIVLNNEALGMITQFQHLYFDGRMPGATADFGYLTPNIEYLAKAYRLPYCALNVNNVDKLLRDACDKYRYCVINYEMTGLTTVSPKLEYDKPISMPLPQLGIDEYDSVMGACEDE